MTRARIGFRARVTYFELGCPETNIDPKNSKKYLVFPVSKLARTLIPAVCLVWEGKRNKVGGGGEGGGGGG